MVQGEFQMALELGEQHLKLAHRQHDPAQILAAHEGLGATLFFSGAFVPGRLHLEQGMAHTGPEPHGTATARYGFDSEMQCICYLAGALWFLGYPDQALRKSYEALGLAQERAHHYNLVYAMSWTTFIHQFRHEVQATQVQAEATIEISRKQNLAYILALAAMWRGWALTAQGQVHEGMAQIREGMAVMQTTESKHLQPYCLALLAEAYGSGGYIAEGLHTLDEALAVIKKRDMYYEAELYRLKGELLLRLSTDHCPEVEACFHQAFAIARRQQARSLELRVTTSLSRLWKSQRRTVQARQLLAESYGWFTEGFDTPDIQEAKVLLQELRT